MTTIVQSQIFFFISSVGFVILGILFAIVLVYIIRAIQPLVKLLEKIENDLDSVGNTTKEMLEEIHYSWVFRFLFKGKRNHKKIIN